MSLQSWFGGRRRGRVGIDSMGGVAPGRRSLRPRVESVEERLMPAVSPLVAPAAGVVGSSSATAAPKSISASDGATWLNSLAKVVLKAPLPLDFVNQTAAQLAQGLPTQAAVTRMLELPGSKVAVSQLAFRFLLGRDVNPNPSVPVSRSFIGRGDLRVALTRVAASQEFWQLTRFDPVAYRTALANDLLGLPALPARFAGRPVATASQRLALARALTRTPSFNDFWTDRLSQIALASGSFSADVVLSARQVIGRPGGMNRALATFLADPLSVRDVTARARPADTQSIRVGTNADQYFLVNRQGLVPDRVTDPFAYGGVSLAAGTDGVPMNSPWGRTAILPQVPYDAIMAGGAVQPRLTFSNAPGAGTVAEQTIQMWFQAKGPGSLLSETVEINGSSVDAPLIYINSSGKLAAGLFDQTPLPIQPGLTVLAWQATSDLAGGESGTGQLSVGAANPIVSQKTVVDNTWHHVALVISGGSQSLYLDGALQGRVLPKVGTSYSYTPVITGGTLDASDSTFSIGGSIVPQGPDNRYPQINYPQGFIGSIDEVATWSTALSQEQVQQAMAAPISQDAGLRSGLVDYFNFDQIVMFSGFPNQASGQSGTLNVPPSSETLVAQSPTTIPTDPFTDPSIARLPGGRAWGLRLMTPLASPSVSLSPNTPTAYKVGLAAGDQLQISIPDGNEGTLTIAVLDDIGTSESASILGGQDKAVRALRTGTYRITLTWAPKTPGSGGVDVNFGLLSGSLNSLVELVTSYMRVAPATQNIEYRWAYADPTIPGINPTAGSAAGDSAADSYWPLWTDARFFPVPAGTAPADWANALSVAYASLVARSPTLKGGYANLIAESTSNPADIQSDLDAAYQALASPPAPGPGQPSPAALQAVYDFFTGVNRTRSTVYAVFTGQGDSSNPINLVNWAAAVFDVFSAQSSVPLGIATTIANGQASQVQDISVSFPNPANLSALQIILQAGVWASGGALGAVIAGPDATVARNIIGALVNGTGASILSDLVGQAGSSSNIGLTVPVTAVTNSIVDAQTLDDLASNINGAMLTQWSTIQKVLTTPAFIQSILSNYGLLAALGEISGTPLALTQTSPTEVATTVLSRASWKTMIPAIFDWQEVSPTALPSGTGQTINLQGNVLPTYNGRGPEDMVTGDFDRDGNLDLVVANRNTDDLTFLPGNGDGTFGAGVTVSLNGADGARGLVVGDFNGDDIPDLAASNYSSNNLSILIGPFTPAGAGSGRFASVTTQKITGKGPIRMAVGDFNDDGRQSLVVANFRTDDLTLLTGFDPTSNLFQSAVTVSLRGPDGASDVATGDFDHDGFADLAVSNYSSNILSVLWGKSGGGFGPATKLSLGGGRKPQGLLAADLDGDHNLDLAVADTGVGDVRVLYGNGDRTFPTLQVLDMKFNTQAFSIFAQPVPGSPLPTLVATWYRPAMVPDSPAVGGMVFFASEGPRQFTPGTYFTTSGNPIFPGLTAGDFDGDGKAEIVAPGNSGNRLTLFRPVDSGTFAGYLPSDVAPATLLSQVAQLQGGNPVSVGPYDRTNLITPKTLSYPPFLGDVSLPYKPGRAPVSVGSPGYFFSVSPASLEQSSVGLNYTDTSALMATAWNLYDRNGNPIAPATLRQLFGAPVSDPSAGPNATKGVPLAPVDPQKPFAALNGGWYYDTAGAPDGFATWADAYFNWGLPTGNPTVVAPPRTLVPYFVPGQGNGILKGNLVSSPSGFEFYSLAYTLTYTAATTAPAGRGVQVDLTSSFNRIGIAANGTVVKNSPGMDSIGDVYSSELLNGPIPWNNLLFRAGPANAPNAIAAQGQTIALPRGNVSKVSFVATGVAGDQASQPFTVTFADGSTYTDNFTLPDWANTSVNASTIALTMPYRGNLNTGTVGGSGIKNGPFNLYGFTLDLPSSKVVASITLPNNKNVVILGITLS